MDGFSANCFLDRGNFRDVGTANRIFLEFAAGGYLLGRVRTGLGSGLRIKEVAEAFEYNTDEHPDQGDQEHGDERVNEEAKHWGRGAIGDAPNTS
jgi:hypothetical protein